MDEKKILEKLHIASLTAMQQEMDGAVRRTDGDVVLLSPTGSGKTLAFMLPLVQLLDQGCSQVQALVVVPGRELAMQLEAVFKSMGTHFRALACYGGRLTIDEHREMRAVEPHVIFGTPGRLNDHLAKGNIAPYAVRFLVIDEFDKCLEMGFQAEMSKLIKGLPGLQRRFLISATDAEQIPEYVCLGHSARVNFLAESKLVANRVGLYEVTSEVKDKLNTLSCLLRCLGQGSSIIFLNYRDSVERTTDFLRSQGFSVSAFHGGMDQKQREAALYRFCNGSANVFVATDLASRGLDIPNVNNIIHYHLPLSEEAYIHRVGRTARWKASGQTFFVLGPEERVPGYVNQKPVAFVFPETLPPLAKPKMSTIYIGKGRKNKLSKGDIAGFLCKKGEIPLSSIGRIDVKERYTYVAISYDSVGRVLEKVRGEKIKGIKTVVENVN